MVQFETMRKMMKGFGDLKNMMKGPKTKQKAKLMSKMKNNGGFPF